MKLSVTCMSLQQFLGSLSINILLNRRPGCRNKLKLKLPTNSFIINLVWSHHYPHCFGQVKNFCDILGNDKRLHFFKPKNRTGWALVLIPVAMMLLWKHLFRRGVCRLYQKNLQISQIISFWAGYLPKLILQRQQEWMFRRRHAQGTRLNRIPLVQVQAAWYPHVSHSRTNLGRAIGHDRSLFTDAHYRLAGGKMFNFWNQLKNSGVDEVWLYQF